MARFPGGGIAYGFYRTKSGAILLGEDRMVATVSSTKVIDIPFASAASSGPAGVRFESEGMHFTLNLAQAAPGGEGEMRMHFRESLSEAVLSKLPAREFAFQVTPEAVVDLFRRRQLM